MVKKDKKVSVVKVKKKLWFKIIAPDVFGKKELGESYLSTPEDGIGKALKVNLRDITGSPKDQQVYISFVIDRVEATSLHTKIMGYELTPAHIKKSVRKNTDRLDDCFQLTTKDDAIIIVKPFMITLTTTQHSLRSSIRKTVFDEIQAEAKKVTFDQFIELIVSNKLQQQLKKKASKCYPLKEVAIRVCKLHRAGTSLPVVETTAPQSPISA